MNKSITLSGSNVEIIENVFTFLSDADTAGNPVSRNLAASLTWSAAGRLSYLLKGMLLAEYRQQPETIARIEKSVEETEWVLSFVAGLANKELLPAPETFTDELETRQTEPDEGLLEELAEMFGDSIEEMESAVRDNQARDRENAALVKKIFEKDEGAKRRIEKTIEAAMAGYTIAPPDLSNEYTLRILDKTADKLDTYIQRARSAALRTSRVKRQTQLAGTKRIMEAVMNGIDGAMERIEAGIQNDFEIPLRRDDDRRQSFEGDSED
jgi:hypothetical protein